MVFKMLYPKVLNIEKGKIIKRVLLLISIIISIILMIINIFIDFTYKWSLLCISGIIYIWFTTLYSLKRNVNVASHVMIQMICISILTIVIDIILGYEGWSITLAIPIMVMIGNVTIMILTIIRRKKYIKYAVYQIIIFILSMIPLFILFKYNIQNYNLPTVVSSSIAGTTLLLTLILCGKDLYNDMIRRFHI